MLLAWQQFTCAGRSPGQPLWDGRLGACQGAAKAAAPVKGAAAKATNAKATAPAQGAALQAIKATHSFCQGGSLASHEGTCSYTKATAPAQGQSCRP